MNQLPVSTVLRSWRVISTTAVLLVSLAFVFWEVDVLLGYPILRTTREEENFLMVNIMLFPLALTTWLTFRFFPPRRGCRVDYQLLVWWLMNCGVSFLIGVIASTGAVDDMWFYDCLTMGLVMMLYELFLGIPFLFLLYFIFRKCSK